ncbi:APC family permease [Arthrobacter mobilis]|uniref:APC family permease n=1 Tax=Arthrobacter mobilis TaxID=2724944 RepID=UPI0028ADA068|nr:APC family permease [Arthrobacter mobilis]
MLTFLDALKRLLVGKPFRSERLKQRPLPKREAFGLFSANALSSVAYSPDEILLTLALAGVAALALSPWVGLAVIVVLLVIVASYRQSLQAYPSGGDYQIASENLGKKAGIAVGSALMLDYVLTVAVSMSSAAHYVVSAVPVLHGWQPAVASAGVVILALMSLRGARKTGPAAAAPTYIFTAAVLLLCAAGFVQYLTGNLGLAPSAAFDIVPEPGLEAGLTGLAGALLVLRAFSTGAAALTGVETPSSNVASFQPPRARNAATTLLALGVAAAVMTMAVIYLARLTEVHVVQSPAQQLRLDGGPVPADYFQMPVLSQLAGTVFGAGHPLFYLVMAATVLVLALAAHMAFGSFPTLASILATDGFLPRQLRTRGDRLGYSNGILTLAGAALVLVLLFRADVTQLIQLYVVGVFVSFTISQLGMIRHWGRQLRATGHRRVRHRMARSRMVNLIGFALTATMLVVVLASKFIFGAWLVVLGIVALSLVMYSINRHYERLARELAVDPDQPATALPSRVHAVILVSHVRKPVLRALAFARASRPSRLDAVVVDIDPAETAATLADWERLKIPVPITVLASPYRETTTPILDYIKNIRRESPRDLVVVYIPEYVVGRWWEQLVHNQTALRIKTRLHFEPGVMVASVPWQLASSDAVRKYQELG